MFVFHFRLKTHTTVIGLFYHLNWLKPKNKSNVWETTWIEAIFRLVSQSSCSVTAKPSKTKKQMKNKKDVWETASEPFLQKSLKHPQTLFALFSVVFPVCKINLGHFERKRSKLPPATTIASAAPVSGVRGFERSRISVSWYGCFSPNSVCTEGVLAVLEKDPM